MRRRNNELENRTDYLVSVTHWSFLLEIEIVEVQHYLENLVEFG